LHAKAIDEEKDLGFVISGQSINYKLSIFVKCRFTDI